MSFTLSNEEEKNQELEELESGEYVCTLTNIKDCKVGNYVKEGDGYVKKGERDGIRFVFKVNDKNAYICKAVKNSTHGNSRLYKMLQELYNAFDLGIEYDALNLCRDKETFAKKLEELKNKTFLVKCEKKDKYTNYVSAKPYQLQQADVKTGFEDAPDHKNEQIEFTEDDLPF